jgi:hypothetical protein
LLQTSENSGAGLVADSRDAGKFSQAERGMDIGENAQDR